MHLRQAIGPWACLGLHGAAAALELPAADRAQPSGWERQTLRGTEQRRAPTISGESPTMFMFLSVTHSHWRAELVVIGFGLTLTCALPSKIAWGGKW